MICADEYPILKQGIMEAHFENEVERFYDKIQQDRFSIFTKPERFLSLLVEQLILFFANADSADPSILFTAPDDSLLHTLGAPIGNVLTTEYIGLVEHDVLNQHFKISSVDEQSLMPTLIVSEAVVAYANNTNLRDKNFVLILPFYQQKKYLGTLNIYLEARKLSECLFEQGYYRTALDTETYPALYFFKQKVQNILEQFMLEISADHYSWHHSYDDFKVLPSATETKLTFLELLEEQETKTIDNILATFQEHFFILDRVFIQLQKKMERYLTSQGYKLDTKGRVDGFSR